MSVESRQFQEMVREAYFSLQRKTVSTVRNSRCAKPVFTKFWASQYQFKCPYCEAKLVAEERGPMKQTFYVHEGSA